MDYRTYRCNMRDMAICVGEALLVSAAVAWLFYKSPFGMVLFVPILVFCYHNCRKTHGEKLRRELLAEFKDAMRSVSSALLAGYSMENAWREAERELGELYGPDAIMRREFGHMNAQVRMNEPLEASLAEFAGRSGCEDIESFSEVFSFAKRGGGDFAGIIQTTVQRMRGKMEVEQEIATTISGKKMESRIMNLVPLLILAYLNVTGGGFLDSLYGNAFGVMVMTGALAGYGAALLLSGKIMDIKI